MRSGQLRRYCAIQRATVTTNTYGEPIQAWSTLTSRWMELRPLGGREYEEAAKQTPEATHAIVMRKYLTTGANGKIAAVLPEDRILFHGRIFQILSVVMVDERNREMRLICKEHDHDPASEAVTVPISGVADYSTKRLTLFFSRTINTPAVGAMALFSVTPPTGATVWNAVGSSVYYASGNELTITLTNVAAADPANGMGSCTYSGAAPTFTDVNGVVVPAFTAFAIAFIGAT